MIPVEELAAAVGATEEVWQPDIEQIETSAIALVERLTGRYFGPPTSRTYTIEGKGGPRLWLPETPRAALASVTETCTPGADPTTILASADDGFAPRTEDNESYLVRHGGGCWPRGREYTATFEVGYDDGEEPQEIRQLISDLVQAKWATRGGAGGGAVRREQFDRYSYELATPSPSGDLSHIPGAMIVIRAWRRRHV